MKEMIFTILGLLDHENDDHWTTEGLPRVDVVQSLIDDDSVTINRDSISNAAPLFKRGERLEPEEDESEEGSEVEKPKLTIEEREDLRSEYNGTIEEAQKIWEGMVSDQRDLAERISEQEKLIADLENKRDTEAPGMSPSEVIAQINANNLAERRRRVEGRNRLGLTANAGGLSEVMMAGKNKRPVFNPPVKE